MLIRTDFDVARFSPSSSFAHAVCLLPFSSLAGVPFMRSPDAAMLSGYSRPSRYHRLIAIFACHPPALRHAASRR